MEIKSPSPRVSAPFLTILSPEGPAPSADAGSGAPPETYRITKDHEARKSVF